MEIISIFLAGAFGGFDFNGDERFAPGRCFKGGSKAYLQLDEERYDVPNQYACVIDVSACLNIQDRLCGDLDYIEAINHVHLHELSHACDECQSTKDYEIGGLSHTFYWNKVLLNISRVKHRKRST